MCVVLFVRSASAYSFSARLGAYDFIDSGARDFYIAAPSVQFTFGFFNDSLVSLELTSGITYTYTAANMGHHFLMVPLYTTFLINIPTGVKFLPYVGAGIGVYYKRDENVSTHAVVNMVTYGYHFTVGFQVPIRGPVRFIFDMKYHLIMVNMIEAMNLSGFNTSIGIGYSFGL